VRVLRSADAASVLVACVAEHDLSAPPPRLPEFPPKVDAASLLDAASYHRVVGCVHHSLRTVPGTPAVLLRELAARYRRSVGTAMLVSAGLRHVRAALATLAAPWVVVKGPVLNAAMYSRPQLRAFSDLDLVVGRTAFPAAVEALEEAGYQVVDRNWQLIRRLMASELHLDLPGSASVDLHWTLVFGAGLRDAFRFPIDDMLGRAREVTVAGLPVLTFDPADTLVHVCLHAALEGGDRLVWLKDIEQVVLNERPDWDVVIARARAYGTALPVGVMLGRARRTLGVPVPLEVRRRLVPLGWRSVVAAAETAFPAGRSRGRGNPATLLARASRESVSATIRTVARGVVNRGRGLAAGQVDRIDVRADASNPGSLFYPAGGAAERTQFFDELVRG
jgi:hypothetical protein